MLRCTILTGSLTDLTAGSVPDLVEDDIAGNRMTIPMTPASALPPIPAREDDRLVALQRYELLDTPAEPAFDQITRLPATARLLMSSDRCRNQAFRLGDVAWATQWHPESSAERVAGWEEDKLRDLGFDPVEVKQTAQDHAEELETTWHAFFERFLAVVRARV